MRAFSGREVDSPLLISTSLSFPSGEFAFGSIWDASAHKNPLAVLLGQDPGRQVAKILSRAYAFDLFVHNDDRHAGNYLCVAGRTAGYSVSCTTSVVH